MEGFSLNGVEIQEYLKSRYPFLMIDHVDEVIPGKKAIGYKNLSLNEWFFPVHYPEYPIMPRTVQLEALEEMLALTILTLPGNKGKTPRFLQASSKFLKNIFPGDKLLIEAYVDSWKRGLLKGTVKAYTLDTIVCESKMIITIPGVLENYLPQK